MTTMEHLFMQIFDRKQWIEGQLKNQVESYGESLAYNLVAEGKLHPPWLWTTRLDGGDYPDKKGLNTDQHVSGMLFPFPRTTTPSGNNSTYFTLPDFVGNKVFQSNKFMETCVLNKYFFTEHRAKAMSSSRKLNPDMVAESEAGEASAESDPLDRIQPSNSRQKDLESPRSDNELSRNDVEEKGSKGGCIGRLIQSRTVPRHDDNVRESSALDITMHHRKAAGGRVTRSRSRSSAQSEYADKLSGPHKSVNCIEDDVRKGDNIQTETQSVLSLSLNDISGIGPSNVMVRHTCITRSADMELELPHVNSCLKMSGDVALNLPDTFPLDEPKKLLFDSIKEHGLRKNSCIFSETESQLSSENSFPHWEVVQSMSKGIFCRDLENFDVSKKDALEYGMEVDVRVSNCGMEPDGLELIEVEDSEMHSKATSDYQFRDVRVSNCGMEQDGLELLEVEDSERRSNPTAGHQESQRDVNRKRSPGSQADEQQSIKLKEECGSDKKSGLNINSIDPLEKETTELSSDIAFNKLRVLQLDKEASSCDRDTEYVSSVNNQLDEDILPNVEVMCEAEEPNIVSGQVLKRREQSSEAQGSGSISLSRSMNRHPDIPATANLKIRSGRSEGSHSLSSPHADRVVNSDSDTSGLQIPIAGDRNKRSLGTPIQYSIEEKNREKLIKETGSPLMNIVQNVDYVTDGVLLVDDVADVRVPKSVLQSIGKLTAVETHDTMLEFSHNLRNSSSSGDKNFGSCTLNGSAFPSSDNADACLTAQATDKGSNMHIKEFSVAKISRTDITHSAQLEVPYLLRSSTCIAENLGCRDANASASYIEENSMLPETKKNEVSVCPEDSTEKSVNCNWITPNSTETQDVSTKNRYFLRSRSSHCMNVTSSSSTMSNYDLKQTKETVARACERSWPKRRKVEYGSNNILATSPRLRFKHPQCIMEGSNCNFKIGSGSKVESQSKPISAELETGTLDSSTRIAENLGCHDANASASYIEENSMLPENKKNEVSVCPEDSTEKSVNCNWITPNSTETQGVSTKNRYFLRRRSSHCMNVTSSGSTMSNYDLKQTKETIARACERSWPKRRKVDYGSNNILATSPRFRLKHPQCIMEGNNCNFKIGSGSKVESQSKPISAELETGTLDSSLVTPLKSQNHAIEGPYLKGHRHTVMTTLPSEHPQGKHLCDKTDRTNISATTICNDSVIEITKGFYNCEDAPDDGALYDTESTSQMHNATSSSHYDSGLGNVDETMPEFEGFSIVLPSMMEDDTISNDSELPILAKERASLIQQLCKSRNVLTPVSCTSSKYKIHEVPDVYQSLPAGLLERMNLSCSLHFDDADMEQLRETANGNLGFQINGSSLGRSHSYSMPSCISSFTVDLEGRKPPLTPVARFSQKVVSGHSVSSSEKIGSNPELICFRIDENSSIADENEHADELDAYKEAITLGEGSKPTNQTTLLDITAEYQNEPISVPESTKLLDRGSLEAVNSESYFRTCQESKYTSNRGSKIEYKENIDLTGNKKSARKAALSLRNRSSKTRISGKLNERSRSHGNMEKGCKPNNIVSNISSFIPLVHQKQQAAATSKGRKDIKVKALEAAEAARRLEEMKQNEREMRKAAAKFEREKLEQENMRRLELNQKQNAGERKKKKADMAARKRQREEEGRKEKERKRRCIEDTRRQKKEREGNSRAAKVEKKLEAEGKERRKEAPVEEAKGQLKSVKGGIVVQCQQESNMHPNISKDIAVDNKNDINILQALDWSQKSNNLEEVVSKSDGLQEICQTRISMNDDNQNQQSYEMSPYKDSDDEEEEEEIWREKKFIPLWARRECLNQVMLSKQHLDPAKIFCRKHSFVLSEVFSTCIHRQPC